MAKTYYDILQVSETASSEIIRAIYNEQITTDSLSDGEKINMNKAYDCLINPERRARYDEKLRMLRSGNIVSEVCHASTGISTAAPARVNSNTVINTSNTIRNLQLPTTQKKDH